MNRHHDPLATTSAQRMRTPGGGLFDPPPPSNGTPTSNAAAANVAPRTPSQRMRIMDYLQTRGIDGATDQEIADALGLDLNTVRPRRGELAEMGAIFKSEATRPTKTGNAAAVWVAK